MIGIISFASLTSAAIISEEEEHEILVQPGETVYVNDEPITNEEPEAARLLICPGTGESCSVTISYGGVTTTYSETKSVNKNAIEWVK